MSEVPNRPAPPPKQPLPGLKKQPPLPPKKGVQFSNTNEIQESSQIQSKFSNIASELQNKVLLPKVPPKKPILPPPNQGGSEENPSLQSNEQNIVTPPKVPPKKSMPPLPNTKKIPPKVPPKVSLPSQSPNNNIDDNLPKMVVNENISPLKPRVAPPPLEEESNNSISPMKPRVAPPPPPEEKVNENLSPLKPRVAPPPPLEEKENENQSPLKPRVAPPPPPQEIETNVSPRSNTNVQDSVNTPPTAPPKKFTPPLPITKKMPVIPPNVSPKSPISINIQPPDEESSTQNSTEESISQPVTPTGSMDKPSNFSKLSSNEEISSHISPRDIKARKRKSSVRKDKKKKADSESNAEEEELYNIEFDKSLFAYSRCKLFPCPDQLEGKYKLKTSSWNERYLVVYCNYLLYFEARSNKPRDVDRPLGAIKLEQVQFKKVREFQDRTEMNAFVPRVISYENCIEVPTIREDGKENMYLIQFDSKETTLRWRDALRSRCKTIDAIKTKVIDSDPKKLVEEISYKFPLSINLKQGPPPGEEEEWIEKMKSVYKARNKYRKSFRRIQYFAEYYSPGIKNYIDWFVTPGGEAGVSSLERDFIEAEDKFVQGWRLEGTTITDKLEEEVFEAKDGDENKVTALQLLLKRKLNCIKWYTMYMSSIYKKEEETFDEEKEELTRYLEICNERAEELEKIRKEEEEKMRKKMEEQRAYEEEQRRILEEERRSDPFYDLTDYDDPFAGLTIVRF